MNEDTKLILEEMAKMKEEIMHEFTAMRQEMNTMHQEMTEEFKAVRHELQQVHDKLDERINDIDILTAQNCKEIIRLRAKQA